MPLEHGSSREVFSRNVADMINAGHPRAQALAASYRQARQGKAAGGRSLARTAGYGDYGTHQPDIDPQDFWANLQHDAPYQKLTRPGDDSGANDIDQKRLEITASQTRPDIRKPGVADGGAINKALHTAKKLAFGGMSPPPYFARVDARQMDAPDAGGVINSEVPGRTDHLPMSPLTGSYVIPADILSGLGEGNTLAGARVVDEMLGTGPWGTKLPRPSHRDTIPRPPRALPEQAKGGDVSDEKDSGTVPILAAGGEYVVNPDTIAHHPLLGNLKPEHNTPRRYEAAMKRGHGILDKWVVEQRKKHIKELQKLPGPSR